MAEIAADKVQKLRVATGVGMMTCKKALEEADGDFDNAINILRKAGEAKAAKRAERVANQGIIASYTHACGRIVTMLELNCETDFVARNEEFKELAHDLAMQVAANNPSYLNPEDVPTDVIAQETEVFRCQLKEEGKPAAVIAKIIPGKLEKFYAENCLSKQPFIKDDSLTVGQKLNEAIAKIGEKISIGRFARFEIGA